MEQFVFVVLVVGLAMAVASASGWRRRYRDLEGRHRVCIQERHLLQQRTATMVKQFPLSKMHRRGVYSKKEDSNG